MDIRARRRALGILVAVLSYNFVDRIALGVMLQSIKSDLGLTDGQLGILTGIAFAAFYALMGLPIARWADRGDRVRIIVITTAMWSVAVSACGFVRSFGELLLIRAVVAVGEAGCIPPAHSLIADYFSRAERPKAVAIYLLGGALSTTLSYPLAGWLNEAFGWRQTFILLGAPGIALAALAAGVLREPRTALKRRSLDEKSAEPWATTAQFPRRPWSALLANRVFRQLLLYFSVMSFFGYGIAQWQATFLIRSYGLSTAEVGLGLGLTLGLGGTIGTYLGGQWAARYAKNNEELQLKALSIACVIGGAVMALAYVCQSTLWSFAFIFNGALIGSAPSGPLYAIVQTIVPARTRATAIALIYLFANLVGMGLGPLAAGALSDLWHGNLGTESLRYALLALSPGYFWGATLLWRASRAVMREIGELNASAVTIAMGRD